jgi:hypothetical protein
MIQHINIKIVPAFVMALLLPCCICSCAYRDGLKSLGTPGDLLSCAKERHVSQVIPCDPCYGFHPTCWYAWSECCPACPPPEGVVSEEVREVGKDVMLPDASNRREVVPAPQQEPPAAKPPEAPRPPQSKPPAPKLPDAPLPPVSLKKEASPPSKGVTNLPPPPRSVTVLPPSPARSDHAGDPTELTALRLAISPRAPQSRPLPVQADSDLGKTDPPRLEETIFPRFCYYEPLLDYTYDYSVAASFARDFTEP